MSVNWPFNEWQLVLATAICLDVVILVLIVTVLRKTKVSRAECARLGQDVKQLAEDIKGLLASEQRRFLKEINGAKKDDDQTPWQREMARPQQATPSADEAHALSAASQASH